MFVIFNFDDMLDGGAAIAKVVILFGLAGITFAPLMREDAIVIPSLTLVIMIAAVISTILTLLEFAKDIKNEKDAKAKTKKRTLLIGTILLTAMLAVVGYVSPIKIWRIYFNNISSMILLPFFFNIVFSFIFEKINYGKINVKDCFSIIWDYIKHRIIGQFLPFTLICLFLFGIIEMFYIMDMFSGDSKEKVETYFEKRNELAVYYNNKFEAVREGKSIETLAQERLDAVMNLLNNEEEFQKFQKKHSGTSESTLRNVKNFTMIYLDQKDIQEEYGKKYGIWIYWETESFQTEKYSPFVVLKVYDDAQRKHLYYKFDFNTKKVGEKLENENKAKEYLSTLYAQEYTERFEK